MESTESFFDIETCEGFNSECFFYSQEEIDGCASYCLRQTPGEMCYFMKVGILND